MSSDEELLGQGFVIRYFVSIENADGSVKQPSYDAANRHMRNKLQQVGSELIFGERLGVSNDWQENLFTRDTRDASLSFAIEGIEGIPLSSEAGKVRFHVKAKKADKHKYFIQYLLTSSLGKEIVLNINEDLVVCDEGIRNQLKSLLIVDSLTYVQSGTQHFVKFTTNAVEGMTGTHLSSYDAPNKIIKLNRIDPSIASTTAVRCRLEAELEIGTVERHDTRLLIKWVNFDRVAEVRSFGEHVFEKPQISIREIEQHIRNELLSSIQFLGN